MDFDNILNLTDFLKKEKESKRQEAENELNGNFERKSEIIGSLGYVNECEDEIIFDSILNVERNLDIKLDIKL